MHKPYPSRKDFCEAKRFSRNISFVLKRQFAVLFVDDDGAARLDRPRQDLLGKAVFDHLADDAL